MSDFVIPESLELDTPIYRFLTFPSLMTILEQRQIPLRKIVRWDDPWEIPARHIKDVPHFNKEDYRVYGNCWSKNPNSDALWRVYSQDRMGVCISSTVGMLKETVVKRHPKISACIAEITYDSAANNLLNDFFGRKFSDKYPPPYTYACMKGKAFEHEQEVRFMVHAKEVSAPTPDFFSVEEINYRHLIKEVIFDPRVEEWYFETMKKYLSRYRILCQKSSLYTTTKLEMKITADPELITRQESD